ncbi:hypothetical protein ACRQ5Q_08335 [Bradyrhizobium sp. PMVTL-01]|uniref:hypothetical protein n=1 Tax=Bradyrhizobium sp. PMVTL-01 TaxID=3434999 RepID=UPI003F72C71E
MTKARKHKTIIELAELGLRHLEWEWLRLLNNCPNRSAEGLERLKRDPLVARLLGDITSAGETIKAAQGRERIKGGSPMTCFLLGAGGVLAVLALREFAGWLTYINNRD